MNETAHPKMREYQRHIGGDSPIYQERKYAAAFSMDLSKTADPYVMRIETFISDSPMSYLSLIGIYDEDLHVRRRIKAACEAAGYAWPEGRTTANFMHPTWPHRPSMCAAAVAASILAAEGAIQAVERPPSTVILGGVNADGTVPPFDGDVDLTALIGHAREQGIQRVILPAADLVRAGRPDGVEIIGVESLRDLKR